MPTSVAADAARVNVQVFLRQADDGPAARVDLDVLVGPRAPRESPAIGRRGLLPAATFPPPAIEDDVDAFLVGEDMPQVLVQLPPLRGHDEEQPLHINVGGGGAAPPPTPPPAPPAGAPPPRFPPRSPRPKNPPQGPGPPPSDPPPVQ